MIPATPESATPTHCRRRKTEAALFRAALNLHSDCVTLRSAIAFESSACFVVWLEFVCSSLRRRSFDLRFHSCALEMRPTSRNRCEETS
jgi:hypothetical protein